MSNEKLVTGKITVNTDLGPIDQGSFPNPLPLPFPFHTKALNDRFNQLGGIQFFGNVVKKEGNIWYCQGGCLYYNTRLKQVFEIHGDIYKKWQALGGLKWGKPDTDELPCPDGRGRYNHFNNGGATISWSPETGAFSIVGDIRTRWAELGWERSYLGYPTSDESDFPDGGRVSAFQHGGIYWWPDTGAIDINDVVINYTGLVCVDKTHEISGSDEPYVLLGLVTPFDVLSYRTRVYSKVNEGDSRPDLMTLFKGKPNGVNISVILMEQDHGNPAQLQQQLTDALQKAHKFGVEAFKLIPIVGSGIAAVVGPLIQHFIPNISQAIGNLFIADDLIGSQNITLTGKDLLLLARRTNNSVYKNVGYKFSTSHIKGHKADYIIYFGIEPA
jgi:hypothetical protein